MSPKPTGRLIATPEGNDLILERVFSAPIDEVWAAITESKLTSKWIASWTGEAGPGKTVRYSLLFEEGEHEADMRIDICVPPSQLVVTTIDENGSFKLEALLSVDGGTTTLTFIHHLDDNAEVKYMGPGWEYYLDMLVASRASEPLPSFDEYLPAQEEYYAGLEPE